MSAHLEDQLPELVHHDLGQLLVVDVGGEEAHGVGEAAEEFGAKFGEVRREELVEPAQEQLQS